MPLARSCRNAISTIGRSERGSNGFGMEIVKGRNLVPFPPARITASIFLSRIYLHHSMSRHGRCQARSAIHEPQTSRDQKARFAAEVASRTEPSDAIRTDVHQPQ